MLLACYSTVPPAQGSRPVSLRDAQAWQQLHAEADALMQKGDFGAAERVAAQALEAGRAGFGGADPNVAASFSTLGSAQLRGGRAAAAEQSFRSALEIYEKRFGANHEFTAAMLNNLGLAREQQGDMAGAELLLRRALAIKEQTLGASHPESAVTLANLARVLDRQGKSGRTGPAPVAGQAGGAASPRDAGQGAALAEEKLHRDALAVQERDLGPGHPTTLATLTNLGNAMLQAGRAREAELVFRRVLAAREARLGPLHPDVAMSLNNVANALFEQSRQEEGDDAARAMRALPRRAPAPGMPGRIGSEAEALYRRALAIQQGQPGANGAAAAATYNNLAVLLAGRGRHDEAEALHRRAIALAEEGLGPGHPDTAAMLATLAATLDRQGRAGEARTLYTRVQGIVREAGGAALLSASANLGASFARRGQLFEALPHYREAVLVHEALRAGGPQRADGTRSTVLERHADVHGELIRILAALVRQSADAGLGREALAVASLNQSRQFSDLLRRAEVLRFSTLPGFEGLRRERERLFATLAEARLARLTVRDGTGGAEAQKAALAGRVAAAEAALKALEGRLWREYPQYMELASPRPVTADDLQRRLLRPGEALLAFAVLPAQTVIFAVTRDTFRLAVAQVGRADLARRVAQVRRPMERVAQGDSPVVLRQLDPVLLAGLYRDLLEPVADIMTGAGQVIVAADDVLHALPMEMLVTRYGNNERARFEAVRGVGDGAAGKPLLAEYADLPYAGASLRFTYLPSLAALASLRGSARAAPVFRRNLVAFGDPVFGAEDGGATGHGESTRMQLAALAGAAADGKPRLARLAETEREVREVAALTGGPALLLLRREAQERRAKSGILRDARYILFATHGFLAGELQVPPDAGDGVTGGAGQGTRVVAQPSLALTLTGDLEGEDGLLTMREVMEELQLEAELVVLSACNSAGDAVEAGNGEGFAGMTRAFMYAGARRLMVSHWSVESPAARALVTGMFRGVTAGRSAVESLALARSETAATILASGGRHFSRAHPFFWAPFVVVGD